MKQLQGLLAFVEAADSGSLTAAAERLEVTPAAVSKNLTRLEAQLGVRLLQRSTRRIALTEEGAGFLVAAREALRALDAAVAGVSLAAATPTGRVRISAAVAFGRRWVLPCLPRLAARHPGLTLELDLDNRAADLVGEGYDIAIRGAVVEGGSLVARRICQMPLVLVASAAYLRRAGVPAKPADLAGHECIGVRIAGAPVTPWRFRGGRSHLPDGPVSVNDPEVVVDLVLAGAGIAQMSLLNAWPYLRSGRLKLLWPGQHDPGTREYVLHYPHRQFLAPRVRVVVEALLEEFRTATDLHLGVADVVAALPQAVAMAGVAP